MIDGPSLAYYAYHLTGAKAKQNNAVLKSSSISRHGWNASAGSATPSYRSISAVFVAWLTALEAHGIKIGAVIFDGALPARKRPIREARCAQKVKAIRKWRAALKSDADLRQTFGERTAKLDIQLGDDVDDNHVVPIDHEISTSSTTAQHVKARTKRADRVGDGDVQPQDPHRQPFLVSHASTSRRPDSLQPPTQSVQPHLPTFQLQDLFSPPDLYTSASTHLPPPPPFLVSAVLETLRKNSRFASSTWIVPGEADPYCAGYAAEHSAIIMTGDSDALAFDLGPDGCVMLLKDLDIDGKSIKGQLYHPANIAKLWGLNSIASFGYAVFKDKHLFLGSLLQNARKAEKDDTSAFRDFRTDYSPVQLPTTTAGSLLQTLDVPFSEWYHQAHQSNQIDRTGATTPLDMWLPFLVEDASRATPWNYARDIRRLAYSLLLPYPDWRSGTMEHLRNGGDLGEAHVLHFTDDELAMAITDVTGYLVEAVNCSACDDLKPNWRELGLVLLCRALSEDNKAAPSRSDLQSVFVADVWSEWELIQFYAQFQAILVSWRILQQSLSVCLANQVGQHNSGAQELYDSLTCMHGETFSDMVDPLGEEQVDIRRLNELISNLFRMLEIPEVVEPGESNISKKKPKKKKNRQQGQPKLPKLTNQSNMYRVLARRA